ncbi:MAG: AraC family transcriptional regulator [Deltaproteobacteria bacterium]
MHSSSLLSGVAQEQTHLNRMTAYLRDHFAEGLNLTDLARLAGFSKFHFHRIFKARYGETPGDYLKRIRLEQAACKLLGNGNASITDIAYECGFSSSQHFAKSFKEHYGVPPGLVRDRFDWRTLLLKKFQVMDSARGKKHCLPADVRREGRFIKIPLIAPGRLNGEAFLELEVTDLPSYSAACIRLHTVPYSKAIDAAGQKIFLWSVSKKLFLRGGGQSMHALDIIPDEEGRYVYDVCRTVPEGMALDDDGEIRMRRLTGGQYGIYHGKFKTITASEAAIKKILIGWWLSSYFPRDRRPLYVIIYNPLAEDASRNWLVDFCFPITTLSSNHPNPKPQDLAQP